MPSLEQSPGAGRGTQKLCSLEGLEHRFCGGLLPLPGPRYASGGHVCTGPVDAVAESSGGPSKQPSRSQVQPAERDGLHGAGIENICNTRSGLLMNVKYLRQTGAL